MARILRIPGTFNHKPSRQCTVRLAVLDTDSPTLSYTQWQAWLPAQPANALQRFQEPLRPGEVRNLPPQTMQKLQTFWPLGTRHQAFIEILHSARRCGYPDSAIELLGQELIDRNHADRRHVESLVRDTIRRIPAY